MEKEFTNGQYDFKKDIITGEKGQEFIRQFLESKGMEYVSDCHDITHDLKMTYSGKTYTYEIKTDVYPKDTGNLVIEFECRGKSSGINATQADYFLTYFPALGEIWNIKTSDLKKLIENKKPRVFSNSGDKNSNTKLYCFKKKDFKPFFKVHIVDKITS